MQVSHAAWMAVASFDDPNLVSAAGLLPVMRLAETAGLRRLADQWLSVPTDKGAHAGTKVESLVAGMAAGADSVDDMALLRHGGMRKLFTHCYAPSTLGSFLRAFTFGHVRQLDAVAARVLVNLAQHAALVPASTDGGLVFVDVDDTIIEVHGQQMQGAGFGYSGVRGINALLVAVSTQTSAPVVIAQRLRKGASGSPRGAARIVADALKNGHETPRPDDPGVVAGGLRLLRVRDHQRGPVSRSGRVCHRPAGPGRQTRHRHHPGGRVDADRIHRRGLRRAGPHLDLERGGRRGALHRVHLPAEERPHHRAPRRPAHPTRSSPPRLSTR